MEYCPHCLKGTEGAYCTHCGGLVKWEAASGQLPVGTMLSGVKGSSYQIGAAKGQGGFGITYAAMNLNNGQRVAIKEYYPSRCANRDFGNHVVPLTGHDEEYKKGIKSFLDEAMMLSAVGALPSVVTVIEYFESNGTAYLVMEYVDGSPLHDVLTKKGNFRADAFLPMLPALLKDIGVLHKSGIIHRDISPDNLILTPEGKLKLIDFGSARSINSAKNMTVLLKPGFSPVEQYQSTGQGPYTDIYAVASTIYYCLTGVVPPASFDRLSNDTMKKPNSLGAGLTAEQEAALMWALSVKAEDRPQSAEVFAQRLFPSADPTPHSAPATVPAKRKLALGIMAAIMALLLVTNGVFAYFWMEAKVASDNYRDQYYSNDYNSLLQRFNDLQSRYNSLLSEQKKFDSKYGELEDQYSELEGNLDAILADENLYLSVVCTDLYMEYFLQCTDGATGELNFNLIKAASLASTEVGNGYTSTRPDGSDSFSVLNEFDVSWKGAVRDHEIFEYAEFNESGEDELYDWVDDLVQYAYENGHDVTEMGIGVNIKDEKVSIVIFMVSV